MELYWPPAVIKYMMQNGQVLSNTSLALAQAALPKTRTSDADKAAYSALLDRYGSFYVDSAWLGGRVDVYVSINKDLFTR